MTGAIAWFTRNHVAANLLMVLLVAGGLLTLPSLDQRVFPEVSLDIINVSVPYPGASPREVEQAVNVRIEEALQGLQGVKRLRSFANEGSGRVSVELSLGEDVRRRMDEVRSRVEAIDTFPEPVETPTVSQADIRIQVIDLAVVGDVGERSLRGLADQVRNDLLALPEIGDVDHVGERDFEIAIEVSEAALLRHDLTFDDVAQAVDRSSLDMAGGAITTGRGQLLLRTKGQAHSVEDFAAIALMTRPDGSELLLGDVASILDGFEESDRDVRFDGRSAQLLRVFRTSGQRALDISTAVHNYAERTNPALPASVELIPWQDEAQFLRDRLSTVLRNARGGLFLVVGVLALFLRLRLALWVSLGIPLSFLGAIWVLPNFGVGVDLISLTAFIVVLGIVVDDAIIVGESVHSEQVRSRGSRLDAAVAGTLRVSTPVIFGVLTTIVAFVPILEVPGPMGSIARIIPIVVIACLCFSLVESLFILPSHLAHASGDEGEAPSSAVSARFRNFQDGVANRLKRFVDNVYLPSLDRALEWRWVCAATAFSVFAVTVAILVGGWLRFTFQPDVEGTTMVAFLTLPAGSPTDLTQRGIEQIESAAEQVRLEVAEAGGHARVFRHVNATLGAQPFRRRQAGGPAAFTAARGRGGHLGEITIEVVPEDDRSISVAELMQRWRDRVGDVPGAVELGYSASLVSAGPAIHLELTGNDLDELGDAATALREELALFPGVVDARNSLREGKPELGIELLPGAESFGISLADVARQVRQAFYGHPVQRLQRDGDEVSVVIRYPKEARGSIADLEAMRVRGAGGAAVPFAAVARAETGRGFASIERVDRRRILTVTAEVDRSVANGNQVVDGLETAVLPDLAERFPAVTFSFGGEQREQAEFLHFLGRGWAIALLVIYGLLAIPLRSYSQPLIIMSAIPFGLVGAVGGHILVGYDFSMFSVIGVVALSGVVVNDSLVFVDCVNRHRAEGSDLHAALRLAGSQRFRAILLTSLTTFVGLLPLLGETSPQAKLLVPMAISLGFGVLFATAITLVLVPVIYRLLEDALTWGQLAPEIDAAPVAGVSPAASSRLAAQVGVPAAD